MNTFIKEQQKEFKRMFGMYGQGLVYEDKECLYYADDFISQVVHATAKEIDRRVEGMRKELTLERGRENGVDYCKDIGHNQALTDVQSIIHDITDTK